MRDAVKSLAGAARVFRFTSQQGKEPMNLGQNARLLGYVQVQVGSQVFALPVQAVHFERDRKTVHSDDPAGGFFTEEGSGQFGIIVDGDASESDVHAQIMKASADAVKHISKRFLN
jgi:hypothetical protein